MITYTVWAHTEQMACQCGGVGRDGLSGVADVEVNLSGEKVHDHSRRITQLGDAKIESRSPDSSTTWV